MTKRVWDQDYIATGSSCLTRQRDALCLLQATSASQKLYRLDLSVFIPAIEAEAIRDGWRYVESGDVHAFETTLLAV